MLGYQSELVQSTQVTYGRRRGGGTLVLVCLQIGTFIYLLLQTHLSLYRIFILFILFQKITGGVQCTRRHTKTKMVKR